MTIRLRYLVAAVGLGLLSPLPSLLANEPLPVRLPDPLELPANNGNLQVAQAIAERLQQSGLLKHYSIDIAFHAGTAELTGRVASEAQRQETLRMVQGVAGVERVVDHLALVSAGGITPVQAEAVQPPKEPAPLLPRPPTPVNPNPIVEPMPMMTGQPSSPYDLNPPKMPPYAWPTYAPYNNYSRVGYPTAYPYNAWPFIGPPYPFPKVPLGWRKVQLEWQDGHWWFSRLGTPHDWWRLRYW